MGQNRNEGRIDKKTRKETKRAVRLLPLVGISLCACGPNHSMKCNGKCRDIHFNNKTNQIECFEHYRLTLQEVKPPKANKSRQTWKRSKQKSPLEKDHRSNFNRGNHRRDDQE